MLYSASAFSRDQLLTDLIALKDRLNGGWLKGGFQDPTNENVCIVAGAEIVTDQPIGFTRFSKTSVSDPNVMRLGRMIYALYVSLAGPKADRNIALSRAMQYIAEFNDSPHSTKAAVNLLVDRAIELALTPTKCEGSADEALSDDQLATETVERVLEDA